MPELPEVETVRRLVRPSLLGRRIESVRVEWLRTLAGDSVRRFRKAVVGARVCEVRRRAKYIVLELERDGHAQGGIVVHLRMTGRLHVDRADEEMRPYTRVACRLDDDNELRFVDVRKFGRFRYAADPQELFCDLGPEPLGSAFQPQSFHDALHSRKRLLKPLLLDQSFLAGLGNIYVDETLHRTRLHPLVRSDRIRRPKAQELHAAIRSTLKEAIAREGSSFDTFYRTPEGQPGSYQDQFRVYGRTGQPCPVCGATIRRLVVGQRGTHVCPRCQRKPRA